MEARENVDKTNVKCDLWVICNHEQYFSSKPTMVSVVNIYFLTIAYPFVKSEHNLYSDLFDEVSSRGNEVTVFCSDEVRRFGAPTETKRGAVRIVSVPTGHITKTAQLVKVLNILLLKSSYLASVSKYSHKKPDLVVYSTPPITFVRVVETLKAKIGCITYLLLKDIFPQNAVDLGMMHQKGAVRAYFRNKEKRLYAVSDHIGCMSPANVRYVLEHNPEIPASKVHVNPNSIRPTPIKDIPVLDKSNLDFYGIPKDRFNLVYGGNLGEPQGITFLLEAVTALSTLPDVYITIVGDGTQYERIADYIFRTGLKNVSLINSIPQKKYRELLICMDIGLIFLDSRFTIPNFPSRVLDYMDMSLPIIAATDDATDIGRILSNAGAGLACKHGDTLNFIACVAKFKEDKEFRKNASKASRVLLEREYSVCKSADILLNVT